MEEPADYCGMPVLFGGSGRKGMTSSGELIDN